MLNTNTHTEYCSKFEIRVLSLKQLENASEEDKTDPNGLYHWAKLFSARSWEEMLMETSSRESRQWRRMRSRGYKLLRLRTSG